MALDLFFPDGQQATPGSNDQSIHTLDAKNSLPTVLQSLNTLSGLPIPANLLSPAGWVCDKEGLLFWVPEDCRNGLTSPAVATIPSTGRHRLVRLDFTHF